MLLPLPGGLGVEKLLVLVDQPEGTERPSEVLTNLGEHTLHDPLLDRRAGQGTTDGILNEEVSLGFVLEMVESH